MTLAESSLRRKLLALVIALLGVAFVACSSGGSGRSGLISPDTLDAFASLAIVDGIEFEFGDEFPVTVEASVGGAFTGGCTRINDVTEQHIGNTIVITMSTNTTDAEGCESDVARFLQFVPLDIKGLSAGVYTVIVNGFSARFELFLDNVAPTAGLEGNRGTRQPQEKGEVIKGRAVVEKIEAVVSGEFPVQVNAIVSGHVYDDCATIDEITLERDRDVFLINVITSRFSRVRCPRTSAASFSEVISLDVADLRTGKYIVGANGASDTFELRRANLTLEQIIGDDVEISDAKIESIEITTLESFPVQVRVLVKGTLPDECSTILPTVQERLDRSFQVNIRVSHLVNPPCDIAPEPFEEIVPLNVFGLEAGTYTVNVNQFSDSFELSVDNVPKTDNAPKRTKKKRREQPSTNDIVIGEVPIQSVEALRLESFPKQITLVVRATLPDTCTSVERITKREKYTFFKITLNMIRPDDFVCDQTPVAFEEIIPIAVTGLYADFYRVIVNGHRDDFLLSVKDGFADPIAIGQADVREIEVTTTDTFPAQVHVTARGILPDEICANLHSITQEQKANTFLIQITTIRPIIAEYDCIAVPLPFKVEIPLDAMGLDAGTYTVTVNGISDAFKLSKDNGLRVDVQDDIIPFNELISNPDKYDGTRIRTEGFHISAFGASGFGAFVYEIEHPRRFPFRIAEPKIAFAGRTQSEEEDCLATYPAKYCSELGRIESKEDCFTIRQSEICRMRVSGVFGYGGRYGPSGAIKYRIDGGLR